MRSPTDVQARPEPIPEEVRAMLRAIQAAVVGAALRGAWSKLSEVTEAAYAAGLSRQMVRRAAAEGRIETARLQKRILEEQVRRQLAEAEARATGHPIRFEPDPTLPESNPSGWRHETAENGTVRYLLDDYVVELGPIHKDGPDRWCVRGGTLGNGMRAFDNLTRARSYVEGRVYTERMERRLAEREAAK